MYQDIINYLYYDYSTVENNDWAFFVFFHVGDFFMRFIYNSANEGTGKWNV